MKRPQRPRARVKIPDPVIPGWLVDFDTGERFRVVRADAVAELVGMVNDRRRLMMRQPDAHEVEQIDVRSPLREKGEWRVRRIDLQASTFHG